MHVNISPSQDDSPSRAPTQARKPKTSCDSLALNDVTFPLRRLPFDVIKFNPRSKVSNLGTLANPNVDELLLRFYLVCAIELIF